MKIQELEKAIDRTRKIFPDRRMVVIVNTKDLSEDETKIILEKINNTEDVSYLTTNKYETRICLMEKIQRPLRVIFKDDDKNENKKRNI